MQAYLNMNQDEIVSVLDEPIELMGNCDAKECPVKWVLDWYHNKFMFEKFMAMEEQAKSS